MFPFLGDNLFDTHCHLNESNYDTDRVEVVARSVASGVVQIVDMSVDIAGAKRAVTDAEQFPGVVFAAAGVDAERFVRGSELYDPNISRQDFPIIIEEMRELITTNRDKFAMVGETGIDRYYLSRQIRDGSTSQAEAESSLALQEELFRMHIELAIDLDLPLSVHTRSADKMCLNIIREYPDARGIFHSYTGGYKVAKALRDLGWGIGVNGIVTYDSANDLRLIMKKLLGNTSDWSPRDFYEHGVYFETDGPFLAPLSVKEQRNEPGFIKEIFERMTQL